LEQVIKLSANVKLDSKIIVEGSTENTVEDENEKFTFKILILFTVRSVLELKVGKDTDPHEKRKVRSGTTPNWSEAATSVTVPDHFGTDPDQTFHFDTDPDPTT
jgi:hypothetical protein